MSRNVIPSTHTCPAVSRYIFQERTLESLTSWFQAAGRCGVEDFAIGAGYPTCDGDAIIATVLHPNADRAPGWYEQRADSSWDDLYNFGRQYSMYYLLQLHTHPPGYGTRHSRRDDIGAFSDRIGFLSIVVPAFALGGINLHAAEVTVHERATHGWRVWPNAEACDRLLLVPASVDLQRDQLAANGVR
jgi:hypothetical protein